MVVRSPQPNVGTPERLGSLAAGALLLLPVTKTRSAWNWGTAAAGVFLLYRGLSGFSPAYRALGVDRAHSAVEPVFASQSVTIGEPATRLHTLWRDPAAFAAILRDFATVAPLGPAKIANHARWIAPLPEGKTAEWETEVIAESPGELFHWRTIPGSRFPHEGTLRFHPAIPASRGTVATLQLSLHPATLPGGTLRFLGLGGVSGTLETLAEVAVRKILRNLKALAEAGEIPTLEKNSSARHGVRDLQGDLL